MHWNLIETAPKDGTWILSWRKFGAGDEPQVSQIRWQPKLLNPDECEWGGYGWSFSNMEIRHPTHWMPLPEPPEGA